MTSLALKAYKQLTPKEKVYLATMYPNVQQFYSKQILSSSKRKIVKNKNKISSVKALKAMTVTFHYYAFFHKYYNMKVPNWENMEKQFFRNIGIELDEDEEIENPSWPKYYWVLIQTFRAAYNHIFDPRDTQYNKLIKNENIDYIDKKLKILNVHKIYKILNSTKTLQNFRNNGY